MHALILGLLTGLVNAQTPAAPEAPKSTAQYEAAEFVFRLARPYFTNPFTDAEVTGEFQAPGGAKLLVTGFCDSPDGRIFRLRFAPPEAGVVYQYKLRFRGGGLDQTFPGELRSTAAAGPGPVIVDPAQPKHFRYAGAGKPFYHLGYTAYHLLDPSRTDAQVDATIDYCARLGFNKIRFLLAGYPRDFDKRTSADAEHGVPDAWKRTNYGALPGSVNPLPVWEGKPHAYDFTRFHIPYWQRVERAIKRMRERGIIATVIVTIEKQDLPREYGRLSEHEWRLYRYAVARLASFDNIWFDLGNEHNEFRDAAWGDAMGNFVKALDPYGRLRSAHAYADFWYTRSDWASFVITQQYGSEREAYDWTRKFAATAKPYINEEYGYEGDSPKAGHLQNADQTRRNHWAIAMAGGYATYGDWSGGVSYFYMGDPGPGKAAAQLKHLRAFFEALPFQKLHPCQRQPEAGFCLSAPELAVYYLPRGGSVEAGGGAARWFNPRSGEWQEATGAPKLVPPDANDWALLVKPRAETTWSPAAAARYFEERQKDWFEWEGSVRPGARCVSCHTGLPYLLAQPVLRRLLGEAKPPVYEQQLLDGVRKRVLEWDTLAAYYPKKEEQSRGTESILYALLLSGEDSPASRAAFERMWQRQDPKTGGWAWLDFDLDPWEVPAAGHFGAALAAVAVGGAPGGLVRPEARAKLVANLGKN